MVDFDFLDFLAQVFMALLLPKETRSQIQRDQAADSLAKAYVSINFISTFVNVFVSQCQFSFASVLVLTINHVLSTILLISVTLLASRRVIFFILKR